MDRKLVSRRYAKRIDLIFLSCVIISLILVFIYGWWNHPTRTKAITKIQTTTLDVNGPEFLLLYNQFWQKFNSVAAVSADNNHDSIVSQTEIDIFRNKFLSDLNLKLDQTQLPFVLNEFNNVVSPDKMSCYLKHYDPKNPDKKQILANC